MTYLRQGTEYLDDRDLAVYRAVRQLTADGRTGNNSQIASYTGQSRTSVANVTAHLRARGYLRDVSKGAAYHWRVTGKPALRETGDPDAPVNWDGRTFGQLTPDEQKRAARAAGKALSAELTANADAISAVLAPQG